MAKEGTRTATDEQIAAYDALLASFSPEEQVAVLRSWKAAQEIGYRTASKEVFAQISPTVVVLHEVQAA